MLGHDYIPTGNLRQQYAEDMVQRWADAGWPVTCHISAANGRICFTTRGLLAEVGDRTCVLADDGGVAALPPVLAYADDIRVSTSRRGRVKLCFVFPECTIDLGDADSGRSGHV